MVMSIRLVHHTFIYVCVCVGGGGGGGGCRLADFYHIFYTYPMIMKYFGLNGGGGGQSP